MPEYASEHAELMVNVAKDIDGVELDFSPRSLEDVDRMVLDMRSQGVTLKDVGEAFFGFGCYLGEVFVRNNDAKWRLTEDTPMKSLAGAPMVVELEPDDNCNPIDKVFKLFENGEGDSIVYFYQVFTRKAAD